MLHSLFNLVSSAIEFILFTVIVKYIIGKWIAEQILKLFKRYVLRTESDVAKWLHYRNKALHKGDKLK